CAVRQRHDEGRDVNAVLLARPGILAHTGDDLIDVACVEPDLRRAEQKRLAALPFISAVELPAADYRINDAVHLFTERAAAAQRQLIDGRERETIRPVVGRDALFQ